jgi:hypothetical protein
VNDLNSLPELSGDYPLANTRAARMLSEALTQAHQMMGLSQRTIAKMLNYKASVVISHMALGRAPIPIDRCMDFARLLKIDQTQFLLAVLEQRHPDIDFMKILVGGKRQLSAPQVGPSYVISDLESIAGCSIEGLPVKKMNIIKEVLADQNPDARWVSMSERPVLEAFRRARPDFQTMGLQPSDRKRLQEFVETL